MPAPASKAILKPDFFACHACGVLTHIDLLDAKPGTSKGYDPNNPNWERFECQPCYGPGWERADS